MRRALVDLNLGLVDCYVPGGGAAGVPRLHFFIGSDWSGPGWCIQIGLGARRRIAQGEMFHRWWGEWPVQWPVRFHWTENRNPSRAWTGRDREIYGVEWGFGYARRFKHVRPVP